MHKSSYDDVKLSCDQVGGKLPIINKNSMIANAEKETNELMKEFTTDVEYNNCMTETDLAMFWLGQNKMDSKGEWVNPYNANEDFSLFKIPGTYQLKFLTAPLDSVSLQICDDLLSRHISLNEC